MTKHEIIIQWLKIFLGIVAIAGFLYTIHLLQDIDLHVKILT